MQQDDQEARAVAPSPPSAIGQGPEYEAEARKVKNYELEKKMGKRLPNGNWCLKRLTPRHLRMIGAHLTGDSNKEIAEHFGIREMTVSRILNDPLAQQFIEVARDDYDLEVKGLIGLAIKAVRDSLRAQDTELRLKGVDKLEKLNKMLNPEAIRPGFRDPEDGEKIEDARERFLHAIERLVDKFAPIMEGEKGDGGKDIQDAEFTIVERKGQHSSSPAKDEHAAIAGPHAGGSPKGSPQ